MDQFKYAKILDISITDFTFESLNRLIYDTVKLQEKRPILNVNIHCFNLIYISPRLKKFFEKTKYIFCDGDGVRLGARLLGYKISEKITFNRWIWNFAEYSQANKITWYCVGAKYNSINKAMSVLKKKYPKLNILGYRSGYITTSEDNRLLLKDINRTQPNVLILGMGMPQQEYWLIDNLSKIDINVALTGGAVFDYISGEFPMTPNIFYSLKLEWLFRFFIDPKRLFKRYFLGNPLFFFRIFVHTFRKVVNTN